MPLHTYVEIDFPEGSYSNQSYRPISVDAEYTELEIGSISLLRQIFLGSYEEPEVYTYYDFSIVKNLPFGIVNIGSLYNNTPEEFEYTDITVSAFNATLAKGIVVPEEIDDYIEFSLLNTDDSDALTYYGMSTYTGEEDFGNIFSIDNPFISVFDSNRALVREHELPLDSTIIQEFTKLEPEVYSPPRELTDLLAGMESYDLDMLEYKLMESPILYSMDSPYIHIGDKLNKTIYPSSPISLIGKASRRRY